MATANKDRQAAFKQKMRDAGMRQISVWLDAGQEHAVKAMLAGSSPASDAESERLSTWAEQLVLERHQLDTRWNELDALIAVNNLRRENLTKLQLVLHEREKHFDRIDAAQAVTQATLDQREQVLTRSAAGDGSSKTVEKRLTRQQRTDHLVEWFTTRGDWRSGGRVAVDDAYSALEKADAMKSLSRQTKTTGTAIGSLLKTYAEEHALLTSSEINLLNDALQVLGNLGAAAGDAKDRVNRSAKKIVDDAQARESAAEQAARSMFPTIPMVDAILLLCHLHGHSKSFELREIRLARLESLSGQSFRQDVAYMEHAAVSEFKSRIRMTITTATGSTLQVAATEAAAAIRVEFEAAREGLLVTHAKLIEHAVTCMTAAKLDQMK